ncbi:RagB/SusD family nutrient uptake outer membrane protein [Olivibacter sitiensis]|uniref:RagB/SusD family nutrient uptake outer membrane protein n=1 Tax=Olivibacter sitiensis TaxID=376470 RepID=UPI00146FBEDF|nr:RagB/SusD family nutrient uptake outer membrane protein [Olivibacter sitiensis]
MNMKKILLLAVLSFLMLSCRKEFLDKKPDKSIITPTTLEELEALLNNRSNLFNGNTPRLPLVATDNIWTTQENLLSANTEVRNSFLWRTDIYEGESSGDWMYQYQRIFYCNVILEQLLVVDAVDDMEKFNQIKGAALFFRAWSHYELSQQFASPYNVNTANEMLGIPIRTQADVNIRNHRASVQETYNAVIADLLEAEIYLPLEVSNKTRPSKIAIWILLARIYLTMHDYGNALGYAKKALSEKSEVIDYNDYNVDNALSFPSFANGLNEEVILHMASSTNIFVHYLIATSYVDTVLVSQYASKDLRKQLFFTDRVANRYTFKGSYAGNVNFTGLAIDELYLIAAECLIRQGNWLEGISTLNQLLEKRWANGFFEPINVDTGEEALSVVLQERRKELIFRGLRWSDLRRLNQDPMTAVTLVRKIGNEEYYLEPNSIRYTFPIPDQEINNSQIEQNPR